MMKTANTRSLWSQILVGAGGVAMGVGALDPLEGSLVILAGSGLVTLGTWLGGSDRRLLVDWLWLFGLILFGVIALFALSAVGGIGGRSGHSLWWGLLVLPYPAGWLLGLANLVRRLIDRIRRPASPM
jgi:purine-cytosine permease-like protein